MIVTDHRHLIGAFRRMRLNRRLTQQQLAARLHVHQHTICYRERSGRIGLDVALETARVFGYDVALIPQRHPGARPTGTGWPA